MALLRSPLHERHVALGAKFAEFAGWEMPLEYAGARGGVLKEHAAVRESVGVFDVSHLGKVVVRGEGARALVDATLSNSLARIEPGRAQYTLCCDETTGGIVDDLIVYLLDDDHLLLVPNAANTAEVVRRLSEAAPSVVSVTDHHTTHAVLAVQGTRSDEVLDAAGLPSGQPYMSFVRAPFPAHGSASGGEEEVVVCRTGYTGERGYEIVAPNAVAPALWDALLAAGAAYDVAPCGLAARDTLRLEMGYPLHGQDISLRRTPNQAGLGWAVGWDKPAFWGREPLLAEREAGPTMRLRGLVATGRGIPRPGMRVLLTRDFAAGEITSGTFSPSLRKGIALAMVNAQIEAGAELSVDVRGRPEVFVVTKPPFVPSHVKES